MLDLGFGLCPDFASAALYGVALATVFGDVGQK